MNPSTGQPFSRSSEGSATGGPSSGLRRLLLGAWAITLAALAVFVGWSSSRRPAPVLGMSPDRPRHFGEFQLTERSGRPVRRAELEGKICVVSFVFTSCGFSCLEVSRNLSRLQTRLATEPDDVRLVSLTVDPRTDTPVVLAKFASRFEASPQRWLFLTGDTAELETLIESSFLPRNPMLASGPLSGAFLGIGRVFLVDRRGRVRGSFDGMDGKSAEALHQAIQKVRTEG